MNAKLKTNIIVTYSFSVIWGIAASFIEDPRFDFMISIVCGILVTQFVALHACSTNKPVPTWSKWLIFFTWPISMHFILLYCKGLKGIAISLGHLAMIFILPMISNSIIFFIYP